ncbi:MAG TPA: hypothetical protein IAA59_10830 [Candidatus Faecaligallichristensenella faecipullorum]|nr:hypothetical protein [Candidatus Faecaligallichristensenella faecipullorum]
MGATLTASFFDSLNPSAIAQQMLLQAMIKNKRTIWFFILGIALANFAMGLAIYYGIAQWISRLVGALSQAYPLPVYGSALIAGLILLLTGIHLIYKTRFNAGKIREGEPAAKAPARLSAASLFVMGAAFCFVELTSAFPYLGFLAMLTGYNLSLPLALLFILLYDFMYILPLILLYLGYNKLQGTVAIQKLERILSKVSAYIVPVFLGVLEAFLIYSGIDALL